MKPQVICLPGSVAPAANRYAPLKAAIGDRAALHLKDLEPYRTDTPPEDYSIEMELAAVDQLAASLGLDRFHLIGYSGGGMISLAYAGTRPVRLLSLGLFEAARVPGQLTPAERNFFDHLNEKLSRLQAGLHGCLCSGASQARSSTASTSATKPRDAEAPCWHRSFAARV